jgi:hypothetical protein
MPLGDGLDLTVTDVIGHVHEEPAAVFEHSMDLAALGVSRRRPSAAGSSSCRPGDRLYQVLATYARFSPQRAERAFGGFPAQPGRGSGRARAHVPRIPLLGLRLPH